MLLLILTYFSCDLSTSNTDDVTDIPASGATTVPTSDDEAKSLYLEVSDALYEKIDPLGENTSKNLLSMTAKEIINIDHDLAAVSGNGLTMKGTVKGTINADMPTTLTAGSFSNTIDITVNLEGTMENFTVTDPTDTTKSYTVSGTVNNTMHNKMSMTMNIAEGSFAVTPSGTLELEISLITNFAVKRSDGTGARFKLIFEDKSGVINLGGLGPTSGGQMPCGADAYDKKATLYTYDDSGKLVAEAEVPLKDTPWMMSNLMGGGTSPSGGGTPPSSTPLSIPDSVADNAAYDIKEADFLTAINNDRTTNSVAALSRDSGLDALARRYADVGKCDPMTENLITRIKLVNGFTSCSDAAHFVFGGDSVVVNTAMNAWLSQTGGVSAMRKTTFTKIGIAVLAPTSIPVGDPPVAECVVVILANPGS
jgi:hypothetical protein